MFFHLYPLLNNEIIFLITKEYEREKNIYKSMINYKKTDVLDNINRISKFNKIIFLILNYIFWINNM